MAKSQIETFIEMSAAGVACDFDTVARHYGMTLDEFEHLAGAFRCGVENGIRAARVRLLNRIEAARPLDAEVRRELAKLHGDWEAKGGE